MPNIQTIITNGNGNVLIGTTTDSGYKLDVSGSARISSANGLVIDGFNSQTGLRLNYGNASGQISVINIIANGITNGFIGIQMVDSSNGDLWFGGSGNRAMTVYRNGNVGIGTDSPNTRLQVNVSNDTAILRIKGGLNEITSIGQINSQIDFASNDTSVFTTDGVAGTIASVNESSNGALVGLAFSTYSQPNLAEGMRINYAGYVGVGTTFPLSRLDVSTTATEALVVGNQSGTISSGDLLGAISFASRDGSTYSSGGITNIRSYATATYNTGSVSGDMRFYVSNNIQNTTQAALFGTEAMRINSNGNLLVGTSTDVGAKIYADGGIRASGALLSGGLLEFTGAWSASPYNGSSWVRPSAGVGVFLVNNAISRWAGFKPNDDFVVNSDNLFVKSSNGYVGIGTGDPSYKFTTYDLTTEPIAYFGALPANASSRNALIVLQSGTIPQSGSDTTGEVGFLFKHSYGTGGVNGTANGGYIESIRQSVFGITSQVNTALVFGTSSANTDAERMRITSDGGVLIGRTTQAFSPSTQGYMLSVGSSTTQAVISVAASGQTLGSGGILFGLDGANGFIVLRQNLPLSFFTNDSERMRITAGGNVLIGTTTDAGFKLRVNGSAKFDGVISADPGITSGYGTFLTGHNSSFQMTINANYSGGQTNTYTPQYAGASTAGMLIMKQRNGGEGSVDIYVKASGTDGSTVNLSTFTYLMALDTNGKVGIGVSSPTLGLEVADGRGFLVGNSGSSGSMYVSPQDENTVNGSWGIANDTADIWLNYRGYQDGFSYFRDTRIGNGKGTAITYWNGDTGNMMIGTTTDSGYKLDVVGTFRASTSGNVARMQTSTNASEVLQLANSGGDSGSVQGITHLGINFFSVGTNSPVRITAYQNGTSGYAGGMYFSTRSANSDSAPVEAMRITHDQLIGLGPVSSFTTTHRVWIDKGSSTYAVYSQGSIQVNAGAIGVGVTPSATTGRIDAGNDIVAYSTSDSRLKENITPIANALDKVKSLTGVEFDWKEETKDVHGYEGHDVGVIAQEVQAVLPEAIRTNDTGYLSVRYEKMIALLIEANKELAARVEELEKKLK
jgi:hypothetical protein